MGHPAPVLTVTSPAEGTTTAGDSIAVNGTILDATPVAVTVNGTPVTVVAGAFTANVALVTGSNVIAIAAVDAAGNDTAVTRTVVRSDASLPPDPSTVAPLLDQTVATTLGAATGFLYSGPNPIQTGVAPSTIDPVRAAALRGKVLDRNDAPLTGVTIRVPDHPEFGQTLSRADGMFDLVVNAGGALKVEYAKPGYLTAVRTVQPRWQDYHMVDDVVLVPLDPAVTAIGFAQPIEVARGSTVTDADGSRRGTLMFGQGTQASMALPGGGTQPLSSAHVRVTEYTTGRNGRAAMPVELPPSTAYTYAAELSVDEALAAGATGVTFSQPVSFYLENFLRFPVGVRVPFAYFDRTRGVWISEAPAVVVRVLDTVGGLASLAVDTTGQAATPAQLAALGISDAERSQMVQLYSPGQSLWRSTHQHFSLGDWNPPIHRRSPPTPSVATPRNGNDNQPDCETGSIIECQNQVLGERLPITGTGLTLNYRSGRTPGYASGLRIMLSGDSLAASVGRIYLVVEIAGRRFTDSFPPLPNQTMAFVWDGKDAFGRPVQGSAPAHVRVGLAERYDFYMTTDAAAAFGMPCDLQAEAPGELRCVIGDSLQHALGETPRFGETFWTDFYVDASSSGSGGALLGTWSARGQRLGGWTLSEHHAYDPTSRTLFLGTGERSGATSLSSVVTTLAGDGNEGSTGDGGPARAAQLSSPSGIVVAPDGGFYIADRDNNRIRRVWADGTITTVAGDLTYGYAGDGGPATAAQLAAPTAIALAPDGSLYIADRDNNRIRRVDSAGVITTVAGTGDVCDMEADSTCGHRTLATSAPVTFPVAVALTPGGDLLVAEETTHFIRWIATDGMIYTVAGTGRTCLEEPVPACGDDGPATQAPVSQPRGLAVGADGTIYLSEGITNKVRRIGVDGVITTIAGDGGYGLGGDGGPGPSARLASPQGLGLGADGSLYIADGDNGRVRRLGTDGMIRTVAGIGEGGIGGFLPGRTGDTGLGAGLSQGLNTFCYRGEGGPAAAALLCRPVSINVTADGRILLADERAARIFQVTTPFPGFANTDYAIPSPTGRDLYQFDSTGRHLATFNAQTGAARLRFEYDSGGLLTRIMGADSNNTTLLRDPGGAVSAIIGPFADTTVLAIDTAGYLQSVTDPGGGVVELVHSSQGLLSSLTDANGNRHAFAYDSLGRLVGDSAPDGGVKRPVQSLDSIGVTTHVTSALGLVTSYVTEGLGTGARRTSITTPDGLTTTRIERPDGSVTLNIPGGVVITQAQRPDPVLGLAAPQIESLTVTTTGGRRFELRGGSRATLTTPGDPRSLVSRHDSALVNGRLFSSEYSASSREFLKTSPEGREITVEVDSLGRAIEYRVPGFNTVFFQYDTAGQLRQVTSGPRSVVYHYDSHGRLDATTDPLGRTTNYRYTSAGRVSSRVQPGGDTVAFGYDAKGNLTSIRPPGRGFHKLAYNQVDLVTGYLPPGPDSLAGKVTGGFNQDRRLVQLDLPDSMVVGFHYDFAGRADSISTPSGITSTTYSSASGLISSISSPGGIALEYAHDGVLPTSVSWAGPVSGAVELAYNNDFAVSQVSVSGAVTADYGYDGDGLLTSAGQLRITRHGGNGLVTGTALGGIATALEYNGFGELSSHTAQVNGDTIYTAEYSRDNAGQITGLFERVRGVETSRTYEYDTLGRLRQVSVDGVSVAVYDYDDNGNRLQVITPGGTTAGTYDDRDRLLTYGSSSYTYTNSGQLSSVNAGGAGTSYAFDVSGHLTSVTLPDSTVVSYLIDGQGRRIGRLVNGALSQGFLWQGQLSLAAELDASGQVVSRFAYGTRNNVPDYMERGGETYRLVTDHLGSVRVVINVANGEVVSWQDFDEWGRVVADSNADFQPFGYAGGLSDRSTKLVRFGDRDYDSRIGRWLSPDPILDLESGSNFYEYARSNPLNVSDPDGRNPAIVLAGGFVGAVFGGYEEFVKQCSFDPKAIGKAVAKGFAKGAVTAFLGSVFAATAVAKVGFGALTNLVGGVQAGYDLPTLLFLTAEGGLSSALGATWVDPLRGKLFSGSLNAASKALPATAATERCACPPSVQ